MADIFPFRAFRYDPGLLGRSVTQPYDKITPAMQERYYAASEHNLVRIILGRREAGDNEEGNVYTRAAAYFSDWRKRGILRHDPHPSIYAYSQRFALPSAKQGSGKEISQVERRGFIALGRIEDYSSGIVYRHEQTLAKPKADRLDLLRATRAHFGQIFMLYEDSGQIDSLLTTDAAPDISVVDEYDVNHQVWQVSDPHLIESVRNAMSAKKLIIADGHHRYETALNYRNECRATNSFASNQSNNDPYEFVMMTFVNMNSRAFLDVDEVDASLSAPAATAMLRECGRAGTTILAVTANRAFLLHHPDPHREAAIFNGLSIRQQALDVVQLHKCLLERVLNLSEESIRNQQNLSYVRDAGEALSQVRDPSHRANIAFLMNPCKMAQVRDIAFAGEVMPQKSTDFYPKLLSGLTIYALD